MTEDPRSEAQVITPELRQWIAEQSRAGHGPGAILKAMKASGWADVVAQSALTDVLGGADKLATIPDVALCADLSAGDRPVQVLMRMSVPRVVVLGNVLSEQECRALMDDAAPRLRRSETVVHATGGSEVNAARTSEGMFFSRGENELVSLLEARLAALVNWPVDHGEGLQVLRYGVGAEYKPHYDYFDPAQPGTAAVLRRGGQRVATIVIYLNTPEEGGATVFPDAGLEVNAIAGQAVFFSYPQPSPSTRTLHGGAPVIKGEKWVATKWLRQGRFD